MTFLTLLKVSKGVDNFNHCLLNTFATFSITVSSHIQVGLMAKMRVLILFSPGASSCRKEMASDGTDTDKENTLEILSLE